MIECTQTNPFACFMATFVRFLLSHMSVMYHSCKQQTRLRHLFNFLRDKVPTSHRSFVFPQRRTRSGQLLPCVLATGCEVFPALCVSAVQPEFIMYWFQILLQLYSNYWHSTFLDKKKITMQLIICHKRLFLCCSLPRICPN